MSSPSVSSKKLIDHAIEVHFEGKLGRLGTRLVTFDLSRHEETVEGYVCRICETYSKNHGMPLHAERCKVLTDPNSDPLILVIGWSLKFFVTPEFRALKEDQIMQIYLAAIAQEDRQSGKDEEEIRHWNEGNEVPKSPVSVIGSEKSFHF